MSDKKLINHGYKPAEKGYKPGVSPAQGGHVPEKSQKTQPANPPKKK